MQHGDEIVLPRLYCIVDTGCFAGSPDSTSAVGAFTRELIAGGAMLIQYRNKRGNARQMVQDAREMVRVREAYFAGAKAPTFSGQEFTGLKPSAPAEDVGVTSGASTGSGQRPTINDQRLILNDRADICLIAGFDGVHVGQDDLSPEAARKIVGTRLWTGVSTHNPEQVAAADRTTADYIAVGPVYATASKQNPDPVIGIEGVRRARELTSKPLVAIGGITRQNCRAVIDAGADSVAVISDLLKDPRCAVEEFLEILK